LHPILFHLGHIAFSTDGVLAALGLLAGLQLSCSLAPKLGVAPDRIWTLGFVMLASLFLGQRLLVIAFNLRDFIDHPFWMLGLTLVRDERYFYAGALLALCAGAGYISAWRLPWLRVADCLAPGAGLALVFSSLGNLAAGADVGVVTSAHWGIIYTSRIAARTSGTPLGVPLLPLALYSALAQAGIAAVALLLILRVGRARTTGHATGFWLFTAGLATVLLEQLRYRFPGELLLADVFTPAQSLGILAVAAGAALLLLRPDTPRT
jgi:phosphatidylglycerol:prolipoprotein diacylglycerol transferase